MTDRAGLEAFWQRWLDTNREAEAANDWTKLVEFYADDAHYGWNVGPDDNFMAVGKDEIREIAVGLEMQGLAGWTYPYQITLIDDKNDMIIGFWKQVADARREDGSNYEIAGFGFSWFKYGDGKWLWQRDMFDHGNAGALFLEMMTAGVLSEGMTNRIEAAMSGRRAPGHYRAKDLPVPMWPTP
ncbi:MAG: nuclear transport factor 2 family protein [Frankiaceae bacterium]|nr:nuclear transport factor 2 family protein [Frankiaceae bacterium]MBV9872282.1 nuclear transport factor 2 family protein [Frankiaceae bacterium]